MAGQTGDEVDDLKKALAESGQVVALAGDILRRKALNHILEQASPVNSAGEPVDLTPPGLADEASDEEKATEPDGAEDVDGAAASMPLGEGAHGPEEADEDSPDEAD